MFIVSYSCRSIDLTSLYVLFSQYKSRSNTLGNSFFQISFYLRAHLRLTVKRQWGKFPWDLYWENKTYKLNRFIVLCFRHTMKLEIDVTRLSYIRWAAKLCIYCQLHGGGGLATAFDLAAFRLSMIAPVKKSVNHSRTVASMRETGCEQQQQVRFRSDSTVRSEFQITINEVPYELFTSRLLMSKRSIKKVHRNLFLMFRRRKT